LGTRGRSVQQHAVKRDESSSDEYSLGDRRRKANQHEVKRDETSSDESSLGDRRRKANQHEVKRDETSSDESSLRDRRRTAQLHAVKRDETSTDESSLGDRKRASNDSKPKPLDEDFDESFIGESESKPSSNQYEHEKNEDFNESPIGAAKLNDAAFGDPTTKQNGTVNLKDTPASSFRYDYSTTVRQSNDYQSAKDANKERIDATTTKQRLKVKVYDESNPQDFFIINVEVDTPSKRQDVTTSDELIMCVLNTRQAVQITQHDNLREDEIVIDHLQPHRADAEESSVGKPDFATASAKHFVAPDLSQLEPTPKSKLPISQLKPEPPVANHLHPSMTFDASQLDPTSKATSPIPTIAPSKEEQSNPEPPTHESSNNSVDQFIIPTIVTATYVKSTPDQKVGLSFRKSKGVVIIEKISPGSVFDGSQLKSGQECLCINDHRIRSARRAAEVVRCAYESYM
jgi:hypothetical protein